MRSLNGQWRSVGHYMGTRKGATQRTCQRRQHTPQHGRDIAGRHTDQLGGLLRRYETPDVDVAALGRSSRLLWKNKKPIARMGVTVLWVSAAGDLALRLQNSMVCHAACLTFDFIMGQKNHRVLQVPLFHAIL